MSKEPQKMEQESIDLADALRKRLKGRFMIVISTGSCDDPRHEDDTKHEQTKPHEGIKIHVSGQCSMMDLIVALESVSQQVQKDAFGAFLSSAFGDDISGSR